LDEGRVENNPEPFDLVEFCEEMKEDFNIFLKAGQKIIHESNQPDITVYLDKRLMKNIFTNLLSNAIKYSEKDSEIRCIIMRHRDRITLEVIDRGIGIPEEDKPYMFGRFFRAGNAININGTGLGLNIVQRYLDLMGGSISFSSHLGKGTTFKVEFPL
jgi:signal transduction histidine kinase